jgi:hypothetical protein
MVTRNHNNYLQRLLQFETTTKRGRIRTVRRWQYCVLSITSDDKLALVALVSGGFKFCPIDRRGRITIHGRKVGPSGLRY